MTVLKSLKNFLSGKSASVEAPDHVCPNCWGKQAYGDRFVEAIEKQKIDLNNLDEKKGWIQAYAVRHFEGIKVEKTRGASKCPSCKVRYRSGR